MRIGYLVNQYPKVSHSFVRREIRALEERGHWVERISLRPVDVNELVDEDDRAEAQLTHSLQGAPVQAVGAALRGALRAGPLSLARSAGLAARVGWGSQRGLARHAAYFAEAVALRDLAEALELEHIHAHFGTNSATVAMIARSLGAPPYSLTVHGPEEFDRPDDLSLQEKIRHAAFVAGVSEFGRSQLFRHAPLECWDKLEVVRCGLDPSFLEAELTPPPRAPRLVCVGRLCEQKGQLILLRAFERIVASIPAAELVLVGDGDMRREVEEEIDRLALRDNVRITGWASAAEVRRELREARALVLPSFAEGLPVVIMEALALGRPVVSTYVAGIPELVTPECGWLVPAGAKGPLVGALREVLAAEPATLARMGEVGRERVARFHDVRTSAAQLEVFFNRSAAA